MVNLLGDLWFEGNARREPDWGALASVPGLALHLYGKRGARPGRKMGHFTVTGGQADEVLERALAARATMGIVDIK
jgi:5-(carboxyamino)imidazole ribonucleotide synthase